MVDDPVFAAVGRANEARVADAERAGGGVLAEHRKRGLPPGRGAERVAARVGQQAERIFVAPARGGGIDDEGLAVSAQRLGAFEQRRDGALPVVLRCRDQVPLADDRPRVAHRGDVEDLREVAAPSGPARPDEVERVAEFERGAVDRPPIVIGSDAPLERVATLRIVVARDERVHAVIRVVAIAGSEVDRPAAADPLQFGRPQLPAVRRPGRRPKDGDERCRADVLQATGAGDADCTVVDRPTVVVIATVKDHRRISRSRLRSGDDRIRERRCEHACGKARQGGEHDAPAQPTAHSIPAKPFVHPAVCCDLSRARSRRA